MFNAWHQVKAFSKVFHVHLLTESYLQSSHHKQSQSYSFKQNHTELHHKLSAWHQHCRPCVAFIPATSSLTMTKGSDILSTDTWKASTQVLAHILEGLIQSREINLYIYSQLIFDHAAKNTQWIKEDAGKIKHSHVKKETRSCLTPFTKH